MIVDGHAHLEDPRFDADRSEVLDRAWDNYVRAILTVHCDLEPRRAQLTLDLTERYPFVWAAFGLHPHEARRWDEAVAHQLTQYWTHPRVVAIGETGLDYHYMHSPREAQRAVFAWHIAQAVERALPLVVHTREAHDDTLALLREAPVERTQVIIHCYTGDAETVRRYLDLGCYISFSGIVTFERTAADVQEAARVVPLDRLLVETDSPYLAPVPYRGRRNEPAYVLKVVEAIARLRGMKVGDLKDAVYQNFLRAYPRVRPLRGTPPGGGARP